MGAVPARVLARRIWSPPDVNGVRGYSGNRLWWVRQPKMDMTKADLRKQARATRRSFAQARGTALFPTDCASFAALHALLPPGQNIAGYVAMGHEADPAALVQNMHSNGQFLCLPWIGEDGETMTFRAWAPGDPLELADHGFSQPLASAPASTPDYVILPLLGFDRAGNRLGQGAGHYDRALAQLPHALRIGLGWSVQECASLPADPWDMPLDAILTEAEWIIPHNSRIKI